MKRKNSLPNSNRVGAGDLARSARAQLGNIKARLTAGFFFL
jgi:hypothetical protein